MKIIKFLRKKLAELKAYHWVIIGAIFFAYYIIPLLVSGLTDGLVELMSLIPSICFLCSVLYGMKTGIKWYYPIVVTVTFLPVLFIYLSFDFGAIYLLILFVSGLLGEIIGGVYTKAQKKFKK